MEPNQNTPLFYIIMKSICQSDWYWCEVVAFGFICHFSIWIYNVCIEQNNGTIIEHLNSVSYHHQVITCSWEWNVMHSTWMKLLLTRCCQVDILSTEMNQSIQQCNCLCGTAERSNRFIINCRRCRKRGHGSYYFTDKVWRVFYSDDPISSTEIKIQTKNSVFRAKVVGIGVQT